MSRADLLLELGCEEIPAGYIPPASERLREHVLGWLAAQGIEHDAGGARSFATPRRLAVFVPQVALRQAEREQQRLGPAVAAAFDDGGQPRPAATGFARSLGVEVDQLERIATDRGERLGLLVKEGGADTRDLLLQGERLREWCQLGFPKTMRWIPGDDLAFARPIRWVVCLLGEEVVPLRLAHLEAGRTSRGHRTLAPRPVEIATPAGYAAALAAAQVEVDPVARRASIDEGAHRLAAEAGGQLHEAGDLLEEISYLVEHPTPVMGSFDPALVERLPPEVIVTAMRSHQRYFSVEREGGGGLLPRFITFRDGGDQGLDNVREGNERVLRARLDDARFYWDSDRQLGSDEKVEQLTRVVWLEGYGSIAEKCARIAELSLRLREELGLAVDERQLERAARLCKSDLATEMIKDGKEFTKLQGTIGRYYALEAGEDGAVADAIAEHLHPRFADDRLPEGELATLVALADRMDSIVGCTLAGFTPTGSADPYALRRQALAVLRILLENRWRLDLSELSRHALANFQPGGGEGEGALALVDGLFWGRMETVLQELPAEIVRAVLAVRPLVPVELVAAARALHGLAGSEDMARLLEGAKRCRNLLAKEGVLAEEEHEGPLRAAVLRERAAARWGAWLAAAGGDDGGLSHDPDRLVEAAERALREAALAAVPALEAARSAGDHTAAYQALSGLGPAISAYFDEVLVNAEDAALRANRLGFLEDLHYLFANFADLARVPSA